MKLVSWNCRGCSRLGFFGQASFYHSLLSMDILFLLDTRLDVELSERLVSKFPFCESFVIPADGQSGCLILLWNDSSFNFRVLFSHSRFIHCLCSNVATGVDWFISFVYMYPHKPLQAALWSDLLHLKPPNDQPGS